MEQERIRVLVAPLDWGLGHASRCIPIITELQENGFEVLIAAEGKTYNLLRAEFPSLQFIQLKGYRLAYSRRLPAWLKVFFQLPKILTRAYLEHAALRKIIPKHKIDAVISDNRFGLWNKKIKSVYITHQLMIKCPRGIKFFEPVLKFIHEKIISRYDSCWIPDFAGRDNLSGDLSHKYPAPSNARFINPVSRFSTGSKKSDYKYDWCAIISGPEPGRAEFERLILDQMEKIKTECIVILGNPHQHTDEQRKNVRVVSHLPAKDLEQMINGSRRIICRAGYSGIMDLHALRKTALLIPTPGQTEQEYLSDYLAAKRIFASCRQTKLDLETYVWDDAVMPENRIEPYNNPELKKAVLLLKDSLNSKQG